jgi:Family of unknown function (DUF5906)
VSSPFYRRNVTAAGTSEESVETGLAPVTDGETVKTGQVIVTVTPGAPAKNATVAVPPGGTKANVIPCRPVTPKDFMSRVVPWPVGGTGYINLHYSMQNLIGGKDIVTGKPFQDIDQLLGFAKWACGTGTIKEIWYCTSLQTEAGTTKNGKPKAKRLRQNARSLKAIWIDIDVKDDPNHYKSLNEAWAAFSEFRKTANLPFPSGVVKSGGGLHIYWFSDKALKPDEWAPFAHGLKALLLKHELKCDAGLTTDNVRLLRLPGTLNHKYNPPRPVELLPLPMTDYDFSRDLAFLKTIAAATNGFTLPDGIGKYDDIPPLPVEPIARDCTFIRDAMITEGKHYTQPMWNLTTLAATFLEKGHELAHRMGRGHPGYTVESTNELWARKNRERADRGLGWPSCKAIQASGCSACASCPHLARGKSPLNLGLIDAKSTTTTTFDRNTNPVAALKKLCDEGANIATLLDAMNEAFAVTKYGGEVVIAFLVGKDISFMTVDHFHKMFANLVICKEGAKPVKVSARWFAWKHRREYLGRGVVFEPGGSAEIANDMLNLWRGFAVTPAQGDWSLMRSHILNVICSGNQQHFDYLMGLISWGVQHLHRPLGVAVAFLGPQGAGKGVVARTYGRFFGKHFSHITHGEQLIGRFNASIGTACAVFLDEAVWAGDKKGEGTLKALITEPTFQVEAKFRDPITVENRLRIMIASNNDWAVPAGVGDRRWFVLNVANTYAGTKDPGYWNALYAELENGGEAAMLHDLLEMDLSGFDVRAIPCTAAKAQQQVRSLQGPESWLYEALQEGAIDGERWQEGGLTVSKDGAYEYYKEFSKQRHEWKPEIKDMWSKKIHAVLGPSVKDTRPTHGNERVRSFQFAPLADCRRQFGMHLGDPDLEWQPDENREQVLGSAAPPQQPDGNEAGGGHRNIRLADFKDDAADNTPETASAPGWRETL